jgi:hypothetical protein
MNYLSVIFVGALLFIILSWFLAKRKTFTGPHVVFIGVDESAGLPARQVDSHEGSGKSETMET